MDSEFCDEIGCDQWTALFFIIEGPGAGQDNLADCDPTSSGSEFDECVLGVSECLAFDADPEECGIQSSECNPEGCTADFEESNSWLYENSGDAGTDYIVVCLTPFDVAEAFTQQTNALFRAREQQLLVQQDGPDDIETIVEEWESSGCDVVTKTWIEPPRREKTRRTGVNLGPLLAAADAERRALQQPAEQVAGVQQQAGGPIRPPNTGDGGLR
jgi:hypothetical protein